MATGCLRNLPELPRNYCGGSTIDINGGFETPGYENCWIEWVCIREDGSRVQSLRTPEGGLQGRTYGI